MTKNEEFYWPAAYLEFEEGGETQVGLFVKELGTMYRSAKFDVELFCTPPTKYGKPKQVVRKVDKRIRENAQDSALLREVDMYSSLAPDTEPNDHFGKTAKLISHQASPAVTVNGEPVLWTIQSTWEFLNLGSVADRMIADTLLLDEQVAFVKTMLVWVQKQNERRDVRDIVVHNDLRAANVAMSWDSDADSLRFGVIDLDIAYTRGPLIEYYARRMAGDFLLAQSKAPRPHYWWDVGILSTDLYKAFVMSLHETDGGKRLWDILQQLGDASDEYNQAFDDALHGKPFGRVDRRIPDLQPYIDQLDELAADIAADKVHVLPCEGTHEYRIDKYVLGKTVDDWEEDLWSSDPSIVPYKIIRELRNQRLSREAIVVNELELPLGLDSIRTMDKAAEYWGMRVAAPCFLVKVDKDFQLLDSSPSTQILGKQCRVAKLQAELILAESEKGTEVEVSIR